MDERDAIGVSFGCIPIAIGFVLAIFGSAIVFPELAAWVLCGGSVLFDPEHKFLFTLEGDFDFLIKAIPFTSQLEQVLLPLQKLHTVFKIIIFVAVPALFIVGVRLLKIKDFRPLAILLNIPALYALYFFLTQPSNGFKLDLIWIITIMLIAGLIIIGIRSLVYGWLKET